MTDRLLRAIENPHVDIIGHPTGRLILKREPYPVDIEAVVDAAARHGVALEINSQIDRLDLSDVQARLARDRGVALVISSDAHSQRGAGRDSAGASCMARRAWLQPADVLNTRPFDGIPRCSAPEPAMTQLKMLQRRRQARGDPAAVLQRRPSRPSSRISAKALDLLKSMSTEDERERATVYMEGLAEMRNDWVRRSRSAQGPGPPRRPERLRDARR